MSKAVFITGTDTGVGKTVVAGAVVKLLKDKGYNVGYFKPVETGCSPECSDAKTISRITGQHIDEVVLYQFKNPVAPLVAERLEGKKIDMARIYSHLDKLKRSYEYLVVEGAGGIKVPITEEDGNIVTYLDFVYETFLPVVVVSRAGLGTINHTVLTVDVLNSVNIEIKGIIVNGYTGDSISERTNPEIIHEMTGVPVISVINRMDNPMESIAYYYPEIVNFIF
ncbi:dethiobiotin synthase [Persephonella atlantica]|uniref:ATP-dependent dethiobiotin synthetase BioD n=1 Tax=Persephonella atlantica TaxID=2699429 RepID=A0ABS1GIE1_9AQUI|nr:dethiobiotin synthase [Persephonella atlantica]MBK3332610.1 dethiobiotin synthase [Persephonella atlantica]